MLEPSEIYLRYRRRRTLVIVSLGVSAAGFVAMFALHQMDVVGILAVQVATGAAILALAAHRFLWRCPACKTFLQMSFFDAFCSKCGAPFRERAE